MNPFAQKQPPPDASFCVADNKIDLLRQSGQVNKITYKQS